MARGLQRDTVEASLSQAAAAMERGDWAAAIHKAEAVIALQPDNADAAAILQLSRFQSDHRDRQRLRYGRRHLSVMFCDLVGSTELSTILDPEMIRDILLVYQRSCASIIESFDGFVAHFMGDGLLAYFGYPTAHEDDARRAVLAAQGIVEAIPTLELPPAAAIEHLAVRVAVHTGLAVVAEMGSGVRVEMHDIVGETPNLASRLQTCAPAQSVVISDATYQLVNPWFEVVAMGPQALKGIAEPVLAYRVTAERLFESRYQALVRPATALVDREVEQEAIIARWEEGGACRQVLTIRGEAGVGKSRLVDFARSLARSRGGQALTLQCTAYKRNSPLHPLIGFLEMAIGPGAPSARLAALTAWAGAAGLTDDDVVPVLASFLRLPLATHTAVSEASPEQLRERCFELLSAWVEQAARRRPLLLVVEDMHWADPSTTEWIQRLVDQEVAPPGMLVLTSRHDLQVRVEGRPTPSLELCPLPPGDCAKIVAAATGNERLPAELCRLIVDRSDGVPLFALELSRMMVEASHRGAELSSEMALLPPTLHDLLVARIDQYPDLMEVAQIVATVGAPVSADFVQKILDGDRHPERRDGQARLDGLVDAHLLERITVSAGTSYQFSHVLQRDAAYGLQLNTRRRQLHAVIAAALEKELADRGEDGFDILAYHYERAGADAAAAELWFRSAVVRASVAAHREAIDAYERARAIMHRHPADLREDFELDVTSALAQSLLATLGYTSELVVQTFRRALELAGTSTTGVQQIPNLFGLWAYYAVRADYAASAQLADRLVETARSDGTANDLLAAQVAQGYQLLMVGRPAEARALLEAGSKWLAPEGPSPFGHHQGVGALTHLASVLWLLGYTDEARGKAGEALVRAEALDGPSAAFSRAYVFGFLADFYNTTGDFDRAAHHAGRTIEVASSFGFATWVGVGILHLAVANANTADPDTSIPVLLEGLRLWEEAGAASHCALFFMMLAVAHRRAGNVRAALDAIERALAHGKETGERYLEAEQRRIRGELLFEATGRRREAVAEITTAVRISREGAMRSYEVRALASLVTLGGAPSDSDIGDPRAALSTRLAWFGDRDEPFLRQARMCATGQQ